MLDLNGGGRGPPAGSCRRGPSSYPIFRLRSLGPQGIGAKGLLDSSGVLSRLINKNKFAGKFPGIQRNGDECLDQVGPQRRRSLDTPQRTYSPPVERLNCDEKHNNNKREEGRTDGEEGVAPATAPLQVGVQTLTPVKTRWTSFPLSVSPPVDRVTPSTSAINRTFVVVHSRRKVKDEGTY